MNPPNAGRGRSQSLAVVSNTPRVTLPDGSSPQTNVREQRLPAHFAAIARQGLIPGGGDNALASADAQAYRRAVCVQRLQANPTAAQLTDAQTNPARGIMGVTSERQNAPLPRQAHPEAPAFMRATQLTPQGQRMAENRMATAMLVSANTPQNVQNVAGVTEQNRGAIRANQFTSISVPEPLVRQMRAAAPGIQVQGVSSAQFQGVRLGWSSTGQSFNAPDFRPAMRGMTQNQAQDFHVVRADPPQYYTRARSASAPLRRS